MILDSYIDNYIGEWNDESGNRLSIKKVDETTALVSFFASPDGQPIHRPWCGEEPTVDMIAKYNSQEEAGLEVDLWGKRRGFTLHLTFEAQYEQARCLGSRIESIYRRRLPGSILLSI